MGRAQLIFPSYSTFKAEKCGFYRFKAYIRTDAQQVDFLSEDCPGRERDDLDAALSVFAGSDMTEIEG